jgi:SMC interacting uncharacterized protein involved in chromosome segregation
MGGLDDKLGPNGDNQVKADVDKQVNVTDATQVSTPVKSSLLDKMKAKIHDVEDEVGEVVHGEDPSDVLLTMETSDKKHVVTVKSQHGLNYNYYAECTCTWQERFKHLREAEFGVNKHIETK